MLKSESIKTLYLSLRGSLARSVAGLVPPKEVEDIVQETYVRICQIKNIDEVESPKPFLFRMVRNLALDYNKRAETRMTDGVENIDEQWSANASVERDELFEQAASSEEFGIFCEAVRLLPVQARRAFVLKKVYGYSQREIAQEMKLSENTVEKHIALGIKRCTLYMQERQQDSAGRLAAITAKKGIVIAHSSRSGGDCDE